jgi:hypothetical protein
VPVERRPRQGRERPVKKAARDEQTARTAAIPATRALTAIRVAQRRQHRKKKIILCTMDRSNACVPKRRAARSDPFRLAGRLTGSLMAYGSRRSGSVAAALMDVLTPAATFAYGATRSIVDCEFVPPHAMQVWLAGDHTCQI